MRHARFAALGLLATIVLATIALADAVRAQYVGAAALFGFERVTVVYATGPGADVVTSRLCAERRAAYLHAKHGVNTTVVSDAAVTPDQLQGDLFVIGWANRLIGTEQAPKPFGPVPDGRAFLGGILVREGEDLLFATASPYNPARRLVFWSRTDVEIDRLMPMPITGSDWAVFRDCTIQRQGNFEDPNAWPPKRNLYAEQDQANVRGKLSAEKKSPRYTMHYVPESYSAPQVDRVLAVREAALKKAIDLVGDPGPGFRIDLFVYPDRATKRAETDVNDPVHSVPAARALHMTPEFAESPSPHEEIHLVVRALWGPCYHTALYEGLAVALERGKDLDLFAAVMVDRGTLPAIASLLDEEALRAMMPDASAFPAAGLFVKWLLDQGGAARVRAVYSAKPLTVEALAAAIGDTPAGTDAAFASWVRSRTATVDPKLRYEAAIVDVDRLLAAGKTAEALASADRALALKPGDSVALLKRSTALAAVDRDAEAEAILRDLLKLPAEGPTLRFVVHAHYQLALLLDDTQRYDEARKHYDAILALPDVEGSHRAANEALGSGGP